MGQSQPIETGDMKECFVFKSTRTTSRPKAPFTTHAQSGPSAFDAFARKIETLKAEQQLAD
ncbi:MAG: hypothetical protein AAF700_03870 [Pseudomonadota bacterium]